MWLYSTPAQTVRQAQASPLPTIIYLLPSCFSGRRDSDATARGRRTREPMDASQQLELVGKLFLAAFCGAVIGWQRDRRQYVAGLRTMALVAAGAGLFTGVNETYGTDRVVSNIVTGIGFLGAGIIFREGGTVRGITTAATVWAVAAIGVALGIGPYLGALVAPPLV